jgi:hypothetical protein
MPSAKKTTDPYAEFRDEEPVIGDNSLAHLRSLAQDQVDAEALVAGLELQLKEAKKGLAQISETELPELMAELDIPSFTLGDGTTISVKEDVFGGITAANQQKAFNWLDEHNQSRLIKRHFIVEFGKDEDKWADKFERDCAKRKLPLHLTRKKTVNPNTLKAFVREQLKEGVDFPMDLFGVYLKKIAKVKIP